MRLATTLRWSTLSLSHMFDLGFCFHTYSLLCTYLPTLVTS